MKLSQRLLKSFQQTALGVGLHQHAPCQGLELIQGCVNSGLVSFYLLEREDALCGVCVVSVRVLVLALYATHASLAIVCTT